MIRKLRRWVMAGAILVLFVVLAVWITKGVVQANVYSAYNEYINTIARETGLNQYLVNLLWVLFLVPLYIGIDYALRMWSRKKRWVGITILVGLYLIYNVGLYTATRDHYRGKWYVRTPNGIELYDRRTEDGKDPVYGYKLKPVTPEIVHEIIALQKGCNTIDPHSSSFFNNRGDPRVWYYKRPDGSYDFFNGPCYHPELGVRLKPITRSVVQDWKQQESSSGERQGEGQIQSLQGKQPGEPDQGPESEADKEVRSPETEGKESRRLETEPREDSRPGQARNFQQEYRQQYLDLSLLERLRGSGPIALVAMEGETSFEYSLVEGIRDRGINARSGLLKSTAFQSVDVSRGLTGGDQELIKRLGLSQLSGYLLHCRLSLREPEPGELYKARATFSVTLVRLDGGRPIQKEFEARGGGFDPADARDQARERVRSDFLSSSIVDRLSRY